MARNQASISICLTTSMSSATRTNHILNMPQLDQVSLRKDEFLSLRQLIRSVADYVLRQQTSLLHLRSLSRWALFRIL